MDILHITLVSAKDHFVIHFVYTAAHSKPETKLTTLLWRRLCKLRVFFTCVSHWRTKLIYVSRSGLVWHLCYITVPHSLTRIQLVFFCVTSFCYRLQNLIYILIIYSEIGVALCSICSAIGPLRHSTFWIFLRGLYGLIPRKKRVRKMNGLLFSPLRNLGKRSRVFKIVVLTVLSYF